MANEQNLRPIKKGDLTKEELKKRQRNGGIKSGEARREKKKFKEICELFLSLDAPERMKSKVRDILPEVADERLSLKACLVVTMIEKIMSGDTKAFEVLRDTIGEKPKDVQDVTFNGNVNVMPSVKINGNDFVPEIGENAGSSADS